ncbi:MAG: hypothetical protein ACR2RL_21315 [Gammaproteobacteria bacterium]
MFSTILHQHTPGAGAAIDDVGRLRKSGTAILLTGTLLVGAAAPPQARSDDPWSYRLGELRADQQANFCDSEDEVMEVARIFEKFSPRTGYSALADAPGCATAVRSFTPRRLVKALTLAAGEANEYQIRFIEVHTPEGDELYLVTTRALME